MKSWPTDHDGTTAADLPPDYSYYPTLFDDHSGYGIAVVGSGIDDSGRETILLALSPGRYLSGTIIGQGKVPGQNPGGSAVMILEALRELSGDAKPGT